MGNVLAASEVVVSPAINLTNTGDSSGDGYFERAPALLKAQSGTWYLAYSKSQTSFTHGGSPDGDVSYDIFIKTSVDSGSTWSSETKILDAAAIGTTSSFRSSTLVEADGLIWVIGADTKGLEGDLYASRFNGTTWSTQTMIFDGTYSTGAFHVDAVAEGDHIRLFYGIQNESLGVGYILYHGDTNTWDTAVTLVGESAAYQIPKVIVDGSTYYLVSTDWGNILFTDTTTPEVVPWDNAGYPYSATSGYYTSDPTIVKYGNSDGTADLIIFHSPGSDSDGSQWLEYTYSTDGGSNWSSSIPFSDALHGSVYSWDMESHAYLKDASTIMVVYSATQRGVSLAQGDVVVSELKIADIGKPHYTTIQDGIDNVDTGGTVTLANGTYIVSDTTITKSLTLIGASRAGVIIAPAAEDTGNGWNKTDGAPQNGLIVQASNVIISTLTIDGNANNVANGGTLPDHYNYRHGIRIADGAEYKNITVDDVNVYNIRRRAIVLYGTVGITGPYIVTDSRIEHVEYQQGISIGSVNATITGNTIIDVNNAISLHPGSTNPDVNATAIISDNTIQQLGHIRHGEVYPSTGIYYRNPNDDRKVIIEDNTISVNNNVGAMVGMYIYNTNSTSIIQGNTLDLTNLTSIDPTIPDTGAYANFAWEYPLGMYLGGCAGTTVSENTVELYGTGSGIYLGRGASTTPVPNIVTRNEIVASNASGTSIKESYGVASSNDPTFDWVEESQYNTNNTISQNFIKDFRNGIVLTDVNSYKVEATISGNSITGYQLMAVYTGDPAFWDGTANASGNFYGSISYAFVKASNSANVDYTPWLASGTDTDLDFDGFQGDFSTLYVDDDSPQTGTTGRIQEGVDLVSGSTVYVLAGDYTEQVTIDISVDLIGAGESTTTLHAPATRTSSVAQGSYVYDYLLAAYAPSDTIDVHIEGFTFDIDGQNKTAGTDRLDGVFFRDVKDAGGSVAGLFASTIHGFDTTTDYESWGLEVRGDSLLTANDLDIHDYTRDGLLVAGDGGDGADPNVTVSNNIVTGSAAPLQGINIMDVSAGSVSGNTVSGNTRSTPWAAVGMLISGSSGVSVTGNHVDGNFYGIFLYDGAHDVTVTGNELTYNIKRGISLDEANNNTISGNTLTGPLAGTDDTGIGLANNCDGNMIGVLDSGNTITMATSGSGLLYAIYMESSVGTGSNTITSNMIIGGMRAIQFDGPPGITGTTRVSYNGIYNQVWGGITAYNNGDLIIRNNTLTNSVRPMEFFGPVNLEVVANTINYSSYSGINLGSFSGTGTVAGNFIHGIVDHNGIWAQTAGAGLDISGNSIYDLSESTPETYAARGIQIDATADGVNIFENEIYNNSSFAGICIDTGQPEPQDQQQLYS